MNSITRRGPRTVMPDLIDWFESPFVTLRPYFAHPIRVEEYTEDGRYVIRAELAGIDPGKDAEITVGPDHLTIHAERHLAMDKPHRTEFRYGSLTRTLSLPADANPDDVTAAYADGILTVTIGTRDVKGSEVRVVE